MQSSIHDLWCQTLQLSQHTPSHVHVTGLSHKPHGKIFVAVGPGFCSISPDRASISNIIVGIDFALVGYEIGLLPV